MKALLIFTLSAAMAAAQNSSVVRSIKRIQRIYVDKMPEGLDRCIRAEIAKQFKGKLTVVFEPEQADAIMAAVSVQSTEVEQRPNDRRVGLQEIATGSISVLDKEGKIVLWSFEVHDRNIWWGATRHGGAQKIADRLVHNLRAAIER